MRFFHSIIVLLTLYLCDHFVYADTRNFKNEIIDIYKSHYPAILAVSKDESKILIKSYEGGEFVLSEKCLSTKSSKKINSNMQGQFSAKWSIDMSRVYYFLDDSGKQDYKLLIKNLASGEERIVKTSRIINPKAELSIDNKYLAYVSLDQKLKIVDIQEQDENIFESDNQINLDFGFSWSKLENYILYVSRYNQTTLIQFDLKNRTEKKYSFSQSLVSASWFNKDNKISVITSGQSNHSLSLITKFGIKNFVLDNLRGDINFVLMSEDDQYLFINNNDGFKNNIVSVNLKTTEQIKETGSLFGNGIKNSYYILKNHNNISRIEKHSPGAGLNKTLNEIKKGLYQRVTTEYTVVKNGEREVSSLLWKKEGVNNPLVIYVHGGPKLNLKDNWSALLEVFLRNDIDVLYLNYGGSTGYGVNYLSEIIYAESDITSAYDQFKDKYSKIILYGDSFGSELIMKALKNKSKNRIVITGFTGKLVKGVASKNRLLVFQGENDYFCSPRCAKNILEQYVDLTDLGEDWFFEIEDEGHSFNRLQTWADILSKIINFIKN